MCAASCVLLAALGLCTFCGNINARTLWLTTARQKCDQRLSKVRSMKPAASLIGRRRTTLSLVLVEQVARRHFVFASSDGSQRGHTDQRGIRTELASVKTLAKAPASVRQKASVRGQKPRAEASKQRQTSRDKALAAPVSKSRLQARSPEALSFEEQQPATARRSPLDREQRQRPPPSSTRARAY